MAAATEQEQKRCLLSKAVVPTHYELTISSDLEACEFSGDVRIHVRITEPTSVIELHADELTFPDGSASVDGVAASRIEHVPDSDGVVRLHFERQLAPRDGAVLSFVGFAGRLTDNMKGYYRSQYTHSSGGKRYMGVTQFEATDARRAFPCWDEPAVKATFSIALVADAELTVISNMPELARSSDGLPAGRVRVQFATTPLMSTYLVAWVVGEFASLAASTKSGTRVGVFTAHDRAADGRFALDTAVSVLEYFEEYYDMPYLLPKLDMIAVPDFAAGAMENWGCVTYRETALLVSANDGLASKQRVAYVVAHELAHQWFGNAVTMEWWRELWLNEGFATYAGQAAVAKVFPEWDMWTAFFSDYVAAALRLDGLRSSHPIEVEVYTSSQISEIFDHISYLKGAAVIRMLAEAVGEQAFRDGLRIYLKRHKFGNAVTTDLWAALSEAAGRDVAKLMAKWTGVTGYPVLSVARAADNPAELVVQQRRFLADGEQADSNSSAAAAAAWDMLLKLQAGDHTTAQHYVADSVARLPLPLPDADYLLVNAGQATFCRVAYADALSKDIVAALAAGRIANPVDRLGLVNDAFALSRAGLTTTSSSLRLVAAYSRESNYRVISVLASWLGTVAAVWAGEPARSHIDALVRHTFAPMLDRLTWSPQQGEDAEAALLRSLVVARLVDAGHAATVDHARSLFALMVSSGADAVPADLRSAVYAAAVKHPDAGQAEFDQLLAWFKTLPEPAERNKALMALGQTTDPALLARYLELGLTDDVRAQDAYLVFSAAGGNRVAPRAAWDFVKSRWSDLNAKLNDALLSRCITSSFSALVGTDIVADVQAFFADHPCPVAERAIAQACESIELNSQWLNRHRSDVADFFNGPDFQVDQSL